MTKKVRGGVDIYIVDMGYAQQIKKRFKKKGFHVKESPKLVGKKRGKNIYRVSISIKEPELSVGDFFAYKGRILQVLKRGPVVELIDIETEDRLRIPPQTLERSEVIARKADARNGIIIAITPNEVQVMDLENKRVYSSKNKPHDVKNGEEVRVVSIDNGVYILPS